MLPLIVVFTFLLLAAICAQRSNRAIVEVIPMILSITVLMLYFLAFFNQMWLVDYVYIILFCGILLLFLLRPNYFSNIRSVFRSSSFAAFLVASIVGIVLLSGRAVSSFDELSFWGVDIRSLYVLEGFAEENRNCAPQFGDYPPATQLLQAWVMHLFGKYSEGLSMVGFFMFFVCYSAPILKKVPNDRTVLLLSVPWILTLFSCFTNVFDNRSPDILMATVYGCLLLTIIREQKYDAFYYLSVSSMLGVLVLIKSTGIQWALFATAFFVLFLKRKDLKRPKLYCSVLFPYAIYATWQVFCVVNDRTTYLTTI